MIKFKRTIKAALNTYIGYCLWFAMIGFSISAVLLAPSAIAQIIAGLTGMGLVALYAWVEIF